ncbi:hypothetical protein [Arthrobacter crystallopoietes]|uniref:Uncharacterized protein n=1 Tax=Crystallibacter crystallopoietes TaxID=37928 RepID=A0A1H1BDK2_9MICC|nr:hypothetical protein [Arthrobacter crystallopoietes]AUI51178.1 hypothetical protein AC20117_10560 [Arthrobacter crystallopoietes]SDQ50078.1 hypothetical protein SAMN04489742_1361 [Arthrobacter crystallopoietes]
MGNQLGIKEPERMTATLRVDAGRDTIDALVPTLMAMRFALTARLYSVLGWQDVPPDEVHGRSYLVGGHAHLVVLHQPRSLDAILVGGSHDGAEIPMDVRIPPLTMGILSGTDCDGDGCSCYDRGDVEEGAEEWSCWQHAGLARDSEGSWRWAYSPASVRGITRAEQRHHDHDGEDHDDAHCSLCRLNVWSERTTRLRLPDVIRENEARQHVEKSPHSSLTCSACRADLLTSRR